MSSPRLRPNREAYPRFVDVPTRWGDNDVYGHVNNVVYYALFDTAINRYLIEVGGLDIVEGPVIGLAVETGCTFARAVRFPDALEAGLRVGRLGTSSVRYEVGIFLRGDAEAAAHGHFVHVFVDRVTRRATPIPPRLRAALAAIATG